MPTISEPGVLTQEEANRIDAMTLRDMLAEWRFAPAGRFQTGDPWSKYFQDSMSAKREADPGAWVSASKSIGWD